MISNIKILIIAVVLIALPSMAQDYMYWDSDFEPISLVNINSKDYVRQGSATATLFFNGDAEITADRTEAAQLSNGTDKLLTEYKLEFDGNGSGNSGGIATSYEPYESFLLTPVTVTHVIDDNDVQITLYVRTSNNPDKLADSGLYNATQTLTITWVGP